MATFFNPVVANATVLYITLTIVTITKKKIRALMVNFFFYSGISEFFYTTVDSSTSLGLGNFTKI